MFEKIHSKKSARLAKFVNRAKFQELSIARIPEVARVQRDTRKNSRPKVHVATCTEPGCGVMLPSVQVPKRMRNMTTEEIASKNGSVTNTDLPERRNAWHLPGYRLVDDRCTR